MSLEPSIMSPGLSEYYNFASPSFTFHFSSKLYSLIYGIESLFGYASNTVTGVDLQYADYKSYRKENETAIPLHVYDAWQNSLSIYNQNSVSLNQYRAGFGLRFQNNKIAISDHLDTSAPDYGGWQTEHDKFTDESNNFAFNIGIDKILNKNNYIYSRIGSGFRYPNIDDRIGGSGDTSLYLKTQKTNDFSPSLKVSRAG